MELSAMTYLAEFRINAVGVAAIFDALAALTPFAGFCAGKCLKTPDWTATGWLSRHTVEKLSHHCLRQVPMNAQSSSMHASISALLGAPALMLKSTLFEPYEKNTRICQP